MSERNCSQSEVEEEYPNILSHSACFHDHDPPLAILVTAILPQDIKKKRLLIIAPLLHSNASALKDSKVEQCEVFYINAELGTIAQSKGRVDKGGSVWDKD